MSTPIPPQCNTFYEQIKMCENLDLRDGQGKQRWRFIQHSSLNGQYPSRVVRSHEIRRFISGVSDTN